MFSDEDIVALVCFLFFIFGLLAWIISIYQGYKLPNRVAFLKPFILKTLIIGGIISVLLGVVFYILCLDGYPPVGLIVGLVMGISETIAAAGFLLFFKTRKALYHHRTAGLKNPTILDDL